MKDETVPHFGQLVYPWIAALALLVIIGIKGYFEVPVALVVLLLVPLSALTGARMERRRAQLQADLESDDGRR